MDNPCNPVELRSAPLLRVAREEIFFGPGPCRLLCLIKERHSVEAAAREMKMSYSKARNIVTRIEKELGESIVVRHPGGHGGGNSMLTEAGDQFIQCYIRYVGQLKIADEQIFRGCFAAYFREGL